MKDIISKLNSPDKPVLVFDGAMGTSLQLLNLSANDFGGDDDSGFCLCIVHGAIEIGGGLIHYPVESGELSEEATRRLTINPNF